MTKKEKTSKRNNPFGDNEGVETPFGISYTQQQPLVLVETKRSPGGSSRIVATLVKDSPTPPSNDLSKIVVALLLVLAGFIVVRHFVAPLALFAIFWILVALIAYGVLRTIMYSGVSLALTTNSILLIAAVAAVSYIVVLQSGNAVSSVLPSF